MPQNDKHARTARIEHMEELLVNARAAVDALEEALNNYTKAQGAIAELNAYYGSEDWFDDREADSRGELDAQLRRGVLSEDLVYDLIIDNRDAALQLLDAAAAYINACDGQ